MSDMTWEKATDGHDIKLKPCPFCGKGAWIRKIEVPRIRTYYIVQCEDSSCLGRITRKFPTAEMAAMKWNERSKPL